MAGRGRPPKETTLRQGTGRINPNHFETIEIDGEIRGPELPDGPDYPDWHPQTRLWWESWRASAQAQKFLATDWDFMLETAFLHTKLWRTNRNGDALAAEIRQRVAKFGATPEDRQRLRMKIVLPGSDNEKSASDNKPKADIRVLKFD